MELKNNRKQIIEQNNMTIGIYFLKYSRNCLLGTRIIGAITLLKQIQTSNRVYFIL